MKINPETLGFIKTYLDHPMRELVLKKRDQPFVDYPFALQQIQVRQKAKYKLPEWSSNIQLVFPPALSLEQSSSEMTAAYKSNLFSGSVLVDLTAGFGVDGIHLSQKFSTTILVEKQKELCEVLEHNIEALKIQNISVIHQDAENYLKNVEFPDPKNITFYLDPARRGKRGEKLFDITDCEPNILTIKELLFQKGNCVILKLSPMLDLKRLILMIPEIREIHIVALQNECKEVIAVCKKVMEQSDIIIHTSNISIQKEEQFHFKLKEEMEEIPVIASQLSGYLYEPNSAIMKSGGFKTIGNRYHLQKVDYHTHLYISDTFISNFPGRSFQIDAVFGMSKRELKVHLQKGEAYNLSTRNFPMDTETLKKKLQIKDGGERYLFATLWNQKHLLILCHKCKE